MRRRWRILHLTASVAETSGQYNEHCLPFLGQRDLSICSFHPPAVDPPQEIACFDGGGTSLGYLRALRAALGRGREYDVIHVHSARAGVLFLAFSLFRPRDFARSVYTVQNSYRNYHLGNRLLLVPIFYLAFAPFGLLLRRGRRDRLRRRLDPEAASHWEPHEGPTAGSGSMRRQY